MTREAAVPDTGSELRGFRPARLALLCGVLGVALILAIAAGLSIGAATVRPWDVLGGTLAGEEAQRAREILLGLRLPRLLLAAIVGAALAAAGAGFQAVLRNPLADPYILGVSGGAALGAILSALVEPGGAAGSLLRPVMAFGGAAATLAILFALARRAGGVSRTALLLTGAVINAFFSALILFVITVVDFARFQRVFFWLVGSLEPPGYGALAGTGLGAGAGILVLGALAGKLNVLALGDEEARSLGAEPDRIRTVAILAASVATASAVAASGLIGFVGLMVPHGVRAVTGPDHRALLPTAALGGAVFLVVADTAARTALAPAEMPVGVVTALCGGPFFLSLFYRGRTLRGHAGSAR